MTTIGTVQSLWRYPVKGMRGEELPELFMGFAGIYGDRCYAFKTSAGRKGFPYLNGNVQGKMLLCRPEFRHPQRAAKPPNLAEASSIGIGVTYANGDADDLALDVVTPSGEVVSIDDPALAKLLGDGINDKHELTLVRSDRALTDCRPVSLIATQTVRQIEAEVGVPLDIRRFRMNVYIEVSSQIGAFDESALIGRRLRIGSAATILVLEGDPRCNMISLDPETGAQNPDVLRHVVQKHDNIAGVYCAVLVEGVLKKGDLVKVFD